VGGYLILGCVIIACLRVLMRANEMFVMSVRDGRTLVMRGGLPLSLRHEIDDVVARARVPRATLRVVRSGGAARLIADGVDPNVAQRLRNVLGTIPDHKLRAGHVMPRRNLGQVLGSAWLAWHIADRGR